VLVNTTETAIDYVKHRSRSRNAVIRVYDSTGNLIEMHEHAGDFNEFWRHVFFNDGTHNLSGYIGFLSGVALLLA